MVGISEGEACRHTCANEEDVIVAVSSSHSVYCDAGEGVAHVGLQEDGSLAMWQHRVVH